MLAASSKVNFERDAEIPTWFGVGGRADCLARPRSVEEVRRCLEMDPGARVLGDGANLLVDDGGVGELVIVLTDPAMASADWGERGDAGRVVAMAGANLPKLITEAVRRGLGGLEGLAGIPATVGGAVWMNAGGAFGQTADVVTRVHGLTRGGREVYLDRAQIDFGYRHSGLEGVIITSVEMRLRPGDPALLRDRLKEVMEYKKRTQPMAERSAGCCFKNPVVPRERAKAEGWLGAETQHGNGKAPATVRVSAGMLIDRAGCKGMSVGGAEVSPWHANFFVVKPGAKARDVIALMGLVTGRVAEKFGIEIEPEVVVWRRTPPGRADRRAGGGGGA
ncbi:MAG: UDP-N-acetylmuramate dehydrogenase [Phycisphaerales bacterium]